MFNCSERSNHNAPIDVFAQKCSRICLHFLVFGTSRVCISIDSYCPFAPTTWKIHHQIPLKRISHFELALQKQNVLVCVDQLTIVNVYIIICHSIKYVLVKRSAVCHVHLVHSCYCHILIRTNIYSTSIRYTATVYIAL